MKKSIVLFLICFAAIAHAQETVQLNFVVGGKIKIKPCKKGKNEFDGIDIYARVSAYDTTKVDRKTGDGLLEAFFQKNTSIDARRLPCIMGGKTYRIACLKEFETPEGTQRVIVCYTAFPLTLIWIDLDKAIENGEIEF